MRALRGGALARAKGKAKAKPRPLAKVPSKPRPPRVLKRPASASKDPGGRGKPPKESDDESEEGDEEEVDSSEAEDEDGFAPAAPPSSHRKGQRRGVGRWEDGSWVDGSQTKLKAAQLPDAEDIIEVELKDSMGGKAGKAIWQLKGAEKASADGQSFRAVFCGSTDERVQVWVTKQASQSLHPHVHICRNGLAKCSASATQGCFMVHVEKFRVRAPAKIKENWYHADRQAGKPQGAGLRAGMPLEDATDEPAPRVDSPGNKEKPAPAQSDFAQKVAELKEKLRVARGDGKGTSSKNAPASANADKPAPAVSGEASDIEAQLKELEKALIKEKSQGNELAEAAQKHASSAGRGRLRERDSRRRRKRRSSSSSGTRSRSPFRSTRTSAGASRPHREAEQNPGKLLRTAVSRVREYLVGRQGVSSDERSRLDALFTPYLTSVLLPSLTEKAGLRNSRELQTLALALDLLIGGDLTRLGDLLAQRFKAVACDAGGILGTGQTLRAR